eukprot:TRINITY_DN486_c2_g1_i1.p1 TRINITY_DN486_c2_g1~~TRINITY_DN486_c2_g1_i1.p1  ORF type:complete len:771 (-),score=96.01 TRINITY_DN486_c2_g1_i1:5106-7418(-)
MEKQRRIAELRRLQQICFPKLTHGQNKENRLESANLGTSGKDRGISVPPGPVQRAKDRLSVWEKYEEKAKNLERNFQRFADKYKSSNKPLAKPLLDNSMTFKMEEGNVANTKEIIEFINGMDQLFMCLKPLLVGDFMEIDKIYRLCKTSLEELLRYNSTEIEEEDCADNFEKILKTFTAEILTLENLMQKALLEVKEEEDLVTLKPKQKVVQDSLSRISRESSGWSLPETMGKLKESLLKAKGTVAASILLRLKEKISLDNKKRAFEVLRDRDHTLFKHHLMTRRTSLLKKFILNSFQSKQRLLLHWLNAWRLYSISPTTIPFSLSSPAKTTQYFYQEIINALTDPFPLLKLHATVRSILTSSIKGTISAELVQYNADQKKLILAVSKPSNDSETEFEEVPTTASSITFATMSGKAKWIEIANLLEDKRFNRRIDYPPLPFPHKNSHLSMLCVPIVSKTTENCIGAIRIYKASGKHMFGPSCKWLACLISQCIGETWDEFNQSVAKKCMLNEKKEGIERLCQELAECMKLEQYACKVLENMLQGKEKEECEKFMLSVLSADKALIIDHEVRNNEICKKAIEKGKCTEVIMNESHSYINKVLRQTLCIPIRRGGEIIGVVQVERTIPEKRKSQKWAAEIKGTVLAVVECVALVVLTRIKQKDEFAQNQQVLEENAVVHKKTEGSKALFVMLQRKYDENLRTGLHLITCRTILKYPTLKVLFIFSQYIPYYSRNQQRCLQQYGHCETAYLRSSSTFRNRQASHTQGRRQLCL